MQRFAATGVDTIPIIFVGAGWQDPIFAGGYPTVHTGPAREVRTLADAQIPVATDYINSGHEWYVWRILLRTSSRASHSGVPGGHVVVMRSD